MKIIDLLSPNELDLLNKLIQEYKSGDEFEVSLFSSKETGSDLLSLENKGYTIFLSSSNFGSLSFTKFSIQLHIVEYPIQTTKAIIISFGMLIPLLPEGFLYINLI